ncbi:MAG TPA: single-stranded-DNA-specific exonuclease RecJ [Candidatus Saccharimonadia bacterium]
MATELVAVPELVRRLLAGRGLTDEAAVQAFLRPDYGRDLHDPWRLTDMRPAVERLVLAAERGERVAVYGDYDIDGITATTVMVESLQAQGLEPLAYIPDRFEEGYGINQQALAYLQGEGVTLVVSVDCGITSVAEAAWAREHGLDLIITDHHAVPAEIPQAVAVINPKRPDDAYPFKDLAGVGVAFKMVQALAQRTGRPAAGQEKWLLDLVAFGTVCDVVQLVGENRALVHYGLKVMAKTRRVGLRALAEVAGFRLGEVRSHHLGFMLGPRLNAAGRLEHAKRSLELVRSADVGRCAEIARELDYLNQQRRDEQQRIVKAALLQAVQYEADPVLVLADEGWSHGIVGIAASKVAETLHKPVLVAQVLGQHTKGSARSVPGFDIVAALRAKPELFERYGGHAFAAGFTLATDRLPELRQHLAEQWAAQAPAVGSGGLVAELELPGVGELTWETLAALEQLEPFGNGNPEPLIVLSGVRVERLARMGSEGKHLRLGLRDGQGERIAAVAFGWGEHAERLGTVPARFVGCLNKNEYQGKTSLQFIIRDILYE